MITLSTGAVLLKDLEPGDYIDGRKYYVNQWLETFIPCNFCRDGCKKQTYGHCAKAYFELWKEKYAQRPLDAWLYREERA